MLIFYLHITEPTFCSRLENLPWWVQISKSCICFTFLFLETSLLGPSSLSSLDWLLSRPPGIFLCHHHHLLEIPFTSLLYWAQVFWPHSWEIGLVIPLLSFKGDFQRNGGKTWVYSAKPYQKSLLNYQRRISTLHCLVDCQSREVELTGRQ